MKLDDLVAASERVRASSSRLEKVSHLASVLARLERDEVPIAVAFLSGELPEGRIGVGPATLAEALPVEPASEPVLELDDVAAAFRRIAEASGPGSASMKLRLLAEPLRRATPREQDFLARLLVGELRQGAQEGVMLEAVAEATSVAPARIRRAVMLAGDAGEVARAVLERGEEALGEFSVRLFRPVKPMLARPAGDVAEALDRLGRAVLEWKVDGARLQVHKRGDEVRVYTRRLNDETAALPEVVEAVRRLEAEELILDGEAVALGEDGSPRRFQDTMRRFGRKRDVARLRRELPLTPFFFDCLYADGEPLLDRPATERYRILDGAVPRTSRIPRRVAEEREPATEFLRESLRAGHEGLVAKDPEADYAAGRRGWNWLKVKPAHTADLLVLAAEWGHGRRRGWLSNLHLGARDAGSGRPVMVGKTFKGLTDETLAWQTERLLELERDREGGTVRVEPSLVVEIAFDGVQRSPRYAGGLALRFARVKGYRPDKPPAEAETLQTLRAIHEGRILPLEE